MSSSRIRCTFILLSFLFLSEHNGRASITSAVQLKTVCCSRKTKVKVDGDEDRLMDDGTELFPVTKRTCSKMRDHIRGVRESLSPFLQFAEMYTSAWKTQAGNFLYTVSEDASEAELLDYLKKQIWFMTFAGCTRQPQWDGATNSYNHESESDYTARLNSHRFGRCERSANQVIEIVKMINKKRMDADDTFAQASLERSPAASAEETEDFSNHGKVIASGGFLYKGKSSDDWRTAENMIDPTNEKVKTHYRNAMFVANDKHVAEKYASHGLFTYRVKKDEELKLFKLDAEGTGLLLKFLAFKNADPHRKFEQKLGVVTGYGANTDALTFPEKGGFFQVGVPVKEQYRLTRQQQQDLFRFPIAKGFLSNLMPAVKVEKLLDSGDSGLFPTDSWVEFGTPGDGLGLPFLNDKSVSDDESAKERFSTIVTKVVQDKCGHLETKYGFDNFEEYENSEYNVGGRISFPGHDYMFFGEFCELLEKYTDFDGIIAPKASKWINKDEAVYTEIILCKRGWGEGKIEVVVEKEAERDIKRDDASKLKSILL